MKRQIRIIALILSITLLTCGCKRVQTNEGNVLNTTINKTNQEENANQSKLDYLKPNAYGNVEGLTLEPGSTISVIGKYAGDSFWKEVEAGAKRAVEDMNSMLGYKGDQKIKLSYSAPNIHDHVDTQVSILDEELDRYPVAIAIASVDSSACFVQYDLAAENGIPIVTFDSGSKYSDIESHIATDNEKAAQTAAKELAALLDGQGEIALVVQDSYSMAAKDRENGFCDVIKEKYPQISIVDIYHMDKLEETAKAIAEEKEISASSISHEDVIAYILEKNPNLKGIFATNQDTSQLVGNVLKAQKRSDLTFVGFDGGEKQLALLENGIAAGLILQNPYGMGYATVIAAARSVLDLGNEAYVNSGYIWVTKENMKEPDVAKMLY